MAMARSSTCTPRLAAECLCLHDVLTVRTAAAPGENDVPRYETGFQLTASVIGIPPNAERGWAGEHGVEDTLLRWNECA